MRRSVSGPAVLIRAPDPEKPPPGAIRWGFLRAARITDVDAADWDRLTAHAGLFMSRRYLRCLEATRPENLEPLYAVVYRGREAIAAIAAQRLEVEAASALRGEFAALLPRLGARLLVCGNVFSWGRAGVAFSRATSPGKLWPAAILALEGLDPRADVVAVKDVSPADPFPPGFRSLGNEPDMVLDLPAAWRSLTDYLAALRTRYRRAARRSRRQLSAAGCRVERLADAGPHAERLHQLYLAVHDTARVRLATAPAAYLTELARLLGDALRCTVIRRDDEIVGFVTTVKDGDTAVGYQLGFDRELGRRLPLYAVLLRASLADAIALGCRRLSLGRTALDSKARLGARPRPLRIAWKGHSILGRALSPIADVRPEAAPVRRPFRATGISS